MKALEIKNLSKNFGGLEVLKNVSFSVEHGEKRAIIGPNGAGKTTLFNIISGITKPDTGEVLFYGKNINHLAPFQRARLGLGRTFQKNNLFSNMSLSDNMKLALYRSSSRPKPEKLLEGSRLKGKGDMQISELSYGEQRQVELMLALAQSPKLILLDEPTAGMSPVEAEEFTEMIGSLPRNITVLMIEHDLEVVYNLADRVTVMRFGEVVCEEDKLKIRSNPQVEEIYRFKDDYEEDDDEG